VTAAPIALRAYSDAPYLVWVLIPVVETTDADIAWYSDFEQSRAEYDRAFAALGFAWRWQPITLANHREVVQAIVRESDGHEPVVLNLCDGDEVNGSPGLSVIRCLKEHGLRFTGADERFYDVTTSKIVMKEAFDRAGVPTSPWAVIPRDGSGITEVVRRLGAPLILKPAVSAGSLGITTKSVVQTPVALRSALKRLSKGYHGWDVAGGGVFVERFVAGPEYTTFIVGSYDDRARATIYPPVERLFNEALPPTERFLSFDRLWGLYETETPLEGDAELWNYRKVPKTLAKRVMDISWAAYEAVGGRGYGRVDLRQDSETGEIHVLEVNAQCGISEDESYTSIGAILRFARSSFASAVGEIIKVSADPGVSRPRLARTRRAATR
jgi:D-alanine-D-alanine ligase